MAVIKARSLITCLLAAVSCLQAEDGKRQLSVPLPLDAGSYASIAKGAGMMVFVEAYKTEASPLYLSEDTIRLGYLLELLATRAKVDVPTAVDIALRGARVNADRKSGVLTIFQSFPITLTKSGTLEQPIAVPEFRGKFKDLNDLLKQKGVDIRLVLERSAEHIAIGESAVNIAGFNGTVREFLRDCLRQKDSILGCICVSTMVGRKVEVFPILASSVRKP